MRQIDIDVLKGIAVTGMVFVHPLLYMTQPERGGDYASYYALGSLLTTPLAGIFLYALGYAMCLKTRTLKRIAARTIYTLSLAMAFGGMLYFINTPHQFMISVLFTAAIVTGLCGLVMNIKEQNRTVSIIGLIILTAMIPVIMSAFEQHNLWISGLLMVLPEHDLYTWKTWEMPMFPFLISGLIGGLAGMRHSTMRDTLIWKVTLVSTAICFAAPLFGMSPPGVIGVIFTLWMPFAIHQMIQFIPNKKIMDYLAITGKHVTSIYFIHHLVMWGVSSMVFHAPFSTFVYGQYAEGIDVPSLFPILFSVILVIASILFAKGIELMQKPVRYMQQNC